MAILPDHSLNAFSGQARKGRPRQMDLTEDQKKELAALYLATNATRNSGSMTLAWSIFCANHPDLGWDASARASKHKLPACAVEVMRHARPLVGYHRGGERKLRQAAYAPGLLRRNLDGSLLRAGQRASWDDATINFGVCVPWPWRGSGDKCAEKYGVRLGRFQLLACHDDATSFIPAYSYIIRYEQTYRGEDVAGAMIRTCRDVGIFDAFVLEGGVWKSDRVQRLLDGLGIRHIDAKGRPQCKLVENFFNRLWSVLSLVPGQVGRYQAENTAMSENMSLAARDARTRGEFFPRWRKPWKLSTGLLTTSTRTLSKAGNTANGSRRNAGKRTSRNGPCARLPPTSPGSRPPPSSGGKWSRGHSAPPSPARWACLNAGISRPRGSGSTRVKPSCSTSTPWANGPSRPS